MHIFYDGFYAASRHLSSVPLWDKIILNLKDTLGPKRHLHSTDEIVPATGIYVVHHTDHRLPHEVILIAGDKFPRCSKCWAAVKFILVREARAGSENHPVRVYELPDLDDEDKKADSAEAKG